MKNLNYLNCNEIAEYDKIVFYKTSPGKGVLTGIRPAISLDYHEYLNNFSTIVNRPPSVYIDPAKEHLKNCYAIVGIERDLLLDRIVKAQSTEFQEICGYCLYHLRSTIDHYVPQTEYSEFSVLAKNLLPACSACNTTKNDVWRNGGRREFLHLYNDLIPDHRFLFGNVRYYNNKPTIQFELRNVNNVVPADKFRLIKSHFEHLGLCDLYRKGVPGVFSLISTMLNGIRFSMEQQLSAPQVQQILIGYAGNLKLKYGINYWKAIAFDIIANDNAITLQLAERNVLY